MNHTYHLGTQNRLTCFRLGPLEISLHLVLEVIVDGVSWNVQVLAAALAQLIKAQGLPSAILGTGRSRDRWPLLTRFVAWSENYFTVHHLGISSLDEACENLGCLITVFLLLLHLLEPLGQLRDLSSLTIDALLP